MSLPRGNPLERLLEQAARSVAGSLHPMEVLERVRAAAEEAIAGDAAPNAIRVAFHPGDFATYGPALDALRTRIESLLAELEAGRTLRRIGDRVITFEQSGAVAAGTVAVTARFVDTTRRTAAPVPAGATGRFVPERGLALILGDGTRVPVTHTPFTIGRGAGNDLLLPGFAVSRRHAELVRSERGYVLRDLGSRNGLTVDGERHDRVLLAPGVTVVLGDFDLTLEQSV